MSPSYLNEILQKLKWQDGFQIPVANTENQLLEEEVAALTLKKVNAKRFYESASQKSESLKSHLKYIQQECEQTQILTTAHVHQVHSEEDIYNFTLAEKNKVNQETRNFEKCLTETKERHRQKENQVQKNGLKLEKVSAETNWDAQALNAWEESLKRRDNDNELIKRFSKEDQKKYNELETQRQNLEVESTVRKQIVEQMVRDIVNCERVLDRTEKTMKQHVVERDSLVNQWKTSTRILHQRDNAIERVATQILESEELLKTQREKLEEQNMFHNNEIKNNLQVEEQQNELNVVISIMRNDVSDLTQHISLLNNEVDITRRAVASTANHLEKLRGKNNQVIKHIENKDKGIEGLANTLQSLKDRQDAVQYTSMTASEKAAHLENLISNDLKEQKLMLNENEVIQALLFRAQQDLKEQNDVAKTKENQIEGYMKGVKNLRKRNKEVSKKLENQKELVYDMDYKIEELQRKVTASTDPPSSDDRDKLEVTLKELEQKKVENTEVRNILKDQVNRIQEDLRRISSVLGADSELLDILKSKLQDRTLNLDGGHKQLDISKLKYQERQVEENMLRLKFDFLEKTMKKQEKTIYTMQTFRLHLEQAMTEHLNEINAIKEILQVKQRHLNEDKGRLRHDLSELHIKKVQFQKKYDMILSTFGLDENGQPCSVTHFKIKNALEKCLLQQEGDDLDSKIRKAENEVVAMENTLKIVNVTNTVFKQSLGAIDDQGREMEEMKTLEDEMFQVNDVLRKNRTDLQHKQNELKEVQDILEEDNKVRDTETKNLEDVEYDFSRIEQQKQNKEEKVMRTEQYMENATNKVSRAEIERYDRDLEVRQLRDANKRCTHKLADIAMSHEEVTPLISRYTIEYSIDLPNRSCSSFSSESTFSTHSQVGKSRSSLTSSTSSLSSTSTISSRSSTSTKSSNSSSSISKVTLQFQI